MVYRLGKTKRIVLDGRYYDLPALRRRTFLSVNKPETLVRLAQRFTVCAVSLLMETTTSAWKCVG
ncbi:hypothetical protein PC116_g27174 [Phytophthora cactorum]|uniref:Uncharacterized protein n=1 Tax=Phytophthora cactorum TaxID=29920 RepID=A0A8T1ECP5_9STRA|nr:hypothetical protein Pcac1_g7751 [Phytophthora cactorum]KAG2928426.1 hypothetical protein PC114_g3102 [Phytophthora cactorum]KAG2952347.1 hypothetical protein PC117_g2873 [Phytophthora cactorum]KAG2980476.1 hypothetical protein PC120_g24959 [Phytophthora cactorum]KAG3039106.1 hypothetical protein PC119_g2437 [Phytophthora cactorum]